MDQDRRGHQRRRFRSTVPGCFYLLHGGERTEFEEVHDVSVSGMGLTLDRPLRPGDEITVAYADASLTLELAAEVAWCEPVDGAWRVGIRFSRAPMQANDNVLFFMSLREYLDDFGELP